MNILGLVLTGFAGYIVYLVLLIVVGVVTVTLLMRREGRTKGIPLAACWLILGGILAGIPASVVRFWLAEEGYWVNLPTNAVTAILWLQLFGNFAALAGIVWLIYAYWTKLRRA